VGRASNIASGIQADAIKAAGYFSLL